MYDDPIARIRRFNRAVTTEVGALDSSFLGRGRPLGAARVLNAVGHGLSDVAALRAFLDLDSGLLSRLLRGLEDEGLLTTHPDPADARRRLARLTAAGRAEFAAYEALSNDRAGRILRDHPNPKALLAAMDLITATLGRDRITIDITDPADPAARWCLAQYYGELARRLHQGFDVARSRDPDAGDMVTPRGAFFVARSDGQPLGCVALKGDAGPMAEVKRLWVAPAARGLKLATRLMAALESHAAAQGVALLRLDTNSALPEAVQLYETAGWTQIDRYNDDPYPDRFFQKELG